MNQICIEEKNCKQKQGKKGTTYHMKREMKCPFSPMGLSPVLGVLCWMDDALPSIIACKEAQTTPGLFLLEYICWELDVEAYACY